MSAPKTHSAYLVTASDEPTIKVGAILLDKGNRLHAEWNVVNFETGVETGAVGRRLSRICADCRVDHRAVGILGHDGECGSQEVKDEARQVLADAKKRIEAES